MLNLIVPDISDRLPLVKSYDAIRDKEQLEIVVDEIEKEKIFRQTIDAVRIPSASQLSFQNLFKIKCANGYFYIAQCLFDFGYPISRGRQSSSQEYFFQILGIANITIDLGTTDLRTETKTDKIVGYLFNQDIDFDEAEIFNDKYYLVSNNREAVEKYFDKKFLNTIAKYDHILLTAHQSQMYISFPQEINANQSRIVQDIFSNFKYLVK